MERKPSALLVIVATIAVCGYVRGENVLKAPVVALDCLQGGPSKAFVRASWDLPLLGFAFGLRVPAQYGSVVSADIEETVLQTLHDDTPTGGPDFFQVEIDPQGGTGVTVVAVFTVESPGLEYLDVLGGLREIVRLQIQPAGEAPTGTNGTLAFTDSLGSPAVETGLSLFPGNWVVPALQDGAISAVRPRLFDDKNDNGNFEHDANPDVSEDVQVVMSEATFALTLQVDAPADRTQTLTPTITGLPPEAHASYAPEPPWELRPGESREITVTLALPPCPTTIVHQLRAAFVGTNCLSNVFTVQCVPMGTVENVWPPPGNSAEAPVVFSEDCAHFEWDSEGPVQSTLAYRANGVDTWSTQDVSFGTEHALDLCNLASETTYEWQIRVPPAWHSKSGFFRMAPGVRFARASYSFNVNRDYDQRVFVDVVNDLDAPAAVRTRILRQSSPDLIVGFVGPGSADDVKTVAAKATGRIELAIHGQDAPAGTYTLAAELVTEGDVARTALAEIRVLISRPNVDFEVTRAGQDAGTLANVIQVKNNGDPITDLAVVLEGDGMENVSVAPSVNHGYLRHGETMTIRAYPKLGTGIDPTAYAGAVKCTGLGSNRTCPFACAIPDGEVLQNPAVKNPLYCVGTGPWDWYCTNKPRIQVPLTFPAGVHIQGTHDANLVVTIQPAAGWHVYPHTVLLYVNGTDEAHRVGAIVNTIPRGRYVFSFDPSLLHIDPERAVTNTVYLHSFHNQGHYVLTTNVELCVCVDEVSGFVYAPAGDAAEAENRLLTLEGLHRSYDGLSVEILAPTQNDTFVQGQEFEIRAVVRNGGRPAPGVAVVAHVGDADTVISLYDNPTHGGDPASGLYANKAKVTKAAPQLTITVIAQSCGDLYKAEVTCGGVEAHPCDSLVVAMNAYPFYEKCCEHGAGCEPYDDDCPDQSAKPFTVAELDRAVCSSEGDAWVVAGMYPAACTLFAGDSLTCGVDANTWCEGAGAGGGNDLALEFRLGEFLPDEWCGVISGWLEGQARVRGAIAHASTLQCPNGADPSVLTRIELAASAKGLPVQEIMAGADMRIRYDRASGQLVYEAPTQLDGGVTLPLPEASFQQEVELIPGLVGTLALTLNGTLQLRAALKTDGSTAPDAVAGGPLVDLDLDGEANVEFPEWMLFPPTVNLEVEDGSGGLLVAEVGLSRRDFGNADFLRTPYFTDFGDRHGVVYSGLRADQPFVFVRLQADAHVTGTIEWLGMETPIDLDVGFNKACHFGNVTVETGGAGDALMAIGGERRKTSARAGVVPPSGKLFCGVEGTANARYHVTISIPVVYHDVRLMPDGEHAAFVADRVTVPLAAKQTSVGQRDWWLLDADAIASDVEARLKGGAALVDAKRAAIGVLDLDKDGVADIVDPSLHPARTPALLEPVGAVPASGKLGRAHETRVILRSPDGPCAGRQVTLASAGDCSIAAPSQTTDGEGNAVFVFTPNAVGALSLTAEFAGDATYAPCGLAWTTDVRKVLEILEPASMSCVHGIVPICIAPVVDPSRTALVLKIDGEEVAAAAGFPETCCSWDTRRFDHGTTHEIQVIATAGNGESSRATAYVTVDNAAVRFKSPTNDDGVRGVVPVCVEPGVGAALTLMIDGAEMPSAAIVDGCYQWDTTGLGVGSMHKLEVAARGCSGFESSASVSVQVIDQAPFRRGMVNDDGAVNIADAICLLDYLFGAETKPCKHSVEKCLNALDCNDDDKVDIADAIKLLGHLFGHTGDLPVPFGQCGADPTSGKLKCERFAPCGMPRAPE